MANLLLDVGNSRIKYAYQDEKDLVGKQTVIFRDDYSETSLQALSKPDAVWIASVAEPSLNNLLISQFQSLWDITPVFITSPVQGYGLRNAYQQPEKLGCDRWLAMLAALKRSKSAVLVVSLGTALTIDAVDPQGYHLGGLIAPGLRMAVNSVLSNTGIQSAELELNVPTGSIFANSTEQCIVHGSVYSISVLIDKAFTELSRMHPNANCYLTGGDAAIIKDALQCEFNLDESLILKGLGLVAASAER